MKQSVKNNQPNKTKTEKNLKTKTKPKPKPYNKPSLERKKENLKIMKKSE